MTRIDYIAKGDAIPEGYDKEVAKFDSCGRVVEKNGRNYKLIGKKNVKLCCVERTARFLVGLAATIFSLGLAYMLSNKVQKLFKPTVSVRLARETNKASMTKKEFLIQRVKENFSQVIAVVSSQAESGKLEVQLSLEGKNKESVNCSVQFDGKEKLEKELNETASKFIEGLEKYSVNELRNKKVSICFSTEHVNTTNESESRKRVETFDIRSGKFLSE